MTTQDIVIVGAGGLGREILDVLEAVNQSSLPSRWKFLGFVDDGTPDNMILSRRGLALIGPVAHIYDLDADFLVAIGACNARASAARAIEAAGLRPASLVDPHARVGTDTDLGPGSVLLPGCVVTTHVSIGRYVIINPNATVGHDSIVGDCTTICPGANVSGRVTIGERSWIGAGAVILQGLTIGSGATIGAGAVVTHPVSENDTVVGIPARSLVRQLKC